MHRVYDGRPGAARTRLRTGRAPHLSPARHRSRRGSRPGASTPAASSSSRPPASRSSTPCSALQGHLPLNPAGMKGVRPDIAFNTAWSFVTNTNWQNYGGESTMSYLTQMAGLAVQNFVSAAVGIAVGRRPDPRLHAIRLRRRSATSGPTSSAAVCTCCSRSRFVLAIVLVVARRRPDVRRPGHAQTRGGGRRRRSRAAPPPARSPSSSSAPTAAASSTPTPRIPSRAARRSTNILELWAQLLIAVRDALPFGRMLGRPRQGVAIFAAMAIMLRHRPRGRRCRRRPARTPALTAAGLVDAPNLEGKEQRLTRRRRRRPSRSARP